MARSDQYIVNDEGTKSDYDIILGDIGLNFFGDTPVRGVFGPVEETTSKVPLIFNDFSNGMGMAYSGIPNTYAFTINGYTRTPRKFMPGGRLTEIDLTGLGWSVDELAGEIRCAIEWFGDVYIGAGSHILLAAGGATTVTDDYDFGVDTQVDSALVYNNIPLFSTDDSFPNWQFLTGYDIASGVWKTATLSSKPVPDRATNPEIFTNPVFLQKMKSIFQDADGVGGNRIVGNDSPTTYIYTQTLDFNTLIGDETAWSTSYQVGDTSYAITGIIETNRIFFITKADGVYGIENAGVYCPNYIPSMKKMPSPFNGISGDYFAGKLFVGSQEGLYMIDVNNKQVADVPLLVSPSYYFANETPIFGIPTATENDNGWLVVAIYNGTDSHICYTRPREHTLATTPNPMIWHGSECTIPGEKITMLFKSSASGRPMMWVGTHDGTRMHLYTLSLPTEGDPYTDYLQGEGHEFALQSKLYLAFQDADDPNAKKVIRRFDVQIDGLNPPIFQTEESLDPDIQIGDIVGYKAAGQVSVYGNSDSGSRIFFEGTGPDAALSEWVLQGILSTSPRASMIPSLNTISGYQIGLLLDCQLLNQAESEAETPVYSPFAVRSIKIRTDVQVEQLEEKVYTVQLSNQKWTNGPRDQGDMQAKFFLLANLQDADAVYMINEDKEKVVVKVEPGMSYRYSRERNSQGYTRVIEFKITLLGRQFYYDIEQQFDSVYAWGS